jgi:hypothetical protein
LQYACICNIQIYLYNIQIKTLATYVWTDETFETYVYSHYNMCNIPIYCCNIDIQHLQYISETLETYSYNMRFQHSIYLLLERRLVDAEIEATE